MPPINILVKPVSSSCNLQCKYCFYNDISMKREISNMGIMDEKILEIIVKKVLEYADYYATFAFQGGEPTLIGIKFYRKLIEFQKEYNSKNIKIRNIIQTNGVAINSEWAQFFADHNFLVDISLDGPKDIHDYIRIDDNRKGSFNKVGKALNLFNKYKVDYNILCVVTRFVGTKTDMVYRYFSKEGFNYLQFIPCLDKLGEEPGGEIYSLTPEIYGNFLKRLFDLWYKDFTEGRKISIRMFDNIINMILGYSPESCDMRGHCTANIVVESDGSVYPCDFYVIDEWKMGNIEYDNLQDLLTGKKAVDFVEVSGDIPKLCGRCEFFNFCRGGCRRHYEPIKNGILKGNYFCYSYKTFFEYALPRLYEIARIISMYNN